MWRANTGAVIAAQNAETHPIRPFSPLRHSLEWLRLGPMTVYENGMHADTSALHENLTRPSILPGFGF
jgi:hypothetical protein